MSQGHPLPPPPPPLHSSVVTKHLDRAAQLAQRVRVLEASAARRTAESEASRLERDADVAASIFQISKIMDETLQRQLDELEEHNRLTVPRD
jgi:hypothetical protein